MFGPWIFTGSDLGVTVGQWTLGSLLKGLKVGSITIADTVASNTATLSPAVVLANSILIRTGWNADTTGGGNDIASNNAYLALTNTTTVTATRGATQWGLVTKFVLIEFVPGVIKSVQRGLITVADATQSNTDTITSVDTVKSCFFPLGTTNDTTGTHGPSVLGSLVLTNATTVTATRGTAAEDNGALLIAYQVVEFY